PDFASLNASPTSIVFAVDRGRMIAAHNAFNFAAETDLAARIAPSFIDAAPEATVIAYDGNDEIARWSSRPIEKRPLAHEADLTTMFGRAFSSKTPPANFLSGVYRRRSATSFKFGPYQRAAALVAALA